MITHFRLCKVLVLTCGNGNFMEHGTNMMS